MQGSHLTTLNAQAALLAQRRMTVVQAQQIASMTSSREGQTGKLGLALSALAKQADALNVDLGQEIDRQREAITSGESPQTLREGMSAPRKGLATQYERAGKIAGAAAVIDDQPNARAVEATRVSAERLQMQTHELMEGLATYDRELAVAQPMAPQMQQHRQMPAGYYPQVANITDMPVWPNVGQMQLDESGRPVLPEVGANKVSMPQFDPTIEVDTHSQSISSENFQR